MISKFCNSSSHCNTKSSFYLLRPLFFVGAFFLFSRGRTPSATPRSERTDTLSDTTVREDGHPQRHHGQRGRTPSATPRSERTDTLSDTTVREDGHPQRHHGQRGRTPSAVSKGLYHKQFYSISSIKEFTYLSKLNST
jgi:hypothetical protein